MRTGGMTSAGNRANQNSNEDHGRAAHCRAELSGAALYSQGGRPAASPASGATFQQFRQSVACQLCNRSSRTMGMALKHPVERGQRYRDLSASRFGVLGTEWIVDAIFRGTDGIQYAQLANASDLTQQKTLAVDVLVDRKRFERV